MAPSFNVLASLASVVLLIVLGMLWYGPLFGKTWMRLVGITSESMQGAQKGMGGKYLIQIIAAILMVFVLAHALAYAMPSLPVPGWLAGAMVGFMNWLGFVAPPTVGMVLWEGKPWKYWWIVAGYWLVGLVLAGIVLAVWA